MKRFPPNSQAHRLQLGHALHLDREMYYLGIHFDTILCCVWEGAHLVHSSGVTQAQGPQAQIREALNHPGGEIPHPLPSTKADLWWKRDFTQEGDFCQIKNLGSGAGVVVLQFLGHNGTPKYRFLRWQGSCLWLWQLQRLVHF